MESRLLIADKAADDKIKLRVVSVYTAEVHCKQCVHLERYILRIEVDQGLNKLGGVQVERGITSE